MLAQARLDVRALEQLLLLRGLQPHRRGDEVRRARRVVDVRDRELQLVGQIRDERRRSGEEAWTLRVSASSSFDSSTTSGTSSNSPMR